LVLSKSSVSAKSEEKVEPTVSKLEELLKTISDEPAKIFEVGK
jgi:hypothetical protein